MAAVVATAVPHAVTTTVSTGDGKPITAMALVHKAATANCHTSTCIPGGYKGISHDFRGPSPEMPLGECVTWKPIIFFLHYSGMYDYAVVGAGIAGLYTAFCVCVRSPRASVVVVERGKELGGRAQNANFHGVRVVTGAGVGRAAKDTRLLALIRALGVHAPVFRSDHTNAMEAPCDTLAADFQRIARAAVTGPPSTFKGLGTRVLGPERYERFVDCAGYSDFEAADAADVAVRYGFEDNFTAWDAVAVPWDDLVTRLRDAVLALGADILSDCQVTRMHTAADGSYVLTCSRGRHPISTKKVVIATAIDGIRTLLRPYPKATALYRGIEGQPFLRLYGKFSGTSAKVLASRLPKSVVIVGRPLQKIIPMDADKGVYMVAYADNASATYLSQFAAEDTPRNRAAVCALLEAALHVSGLVMDAMLGFYFANGTHFYRPLDTSRFPTRAAYIAAAQRPLPNVFVVGEVVSEDQGWTEGALQSVEAVLSRKT